MSHSILRHRQVGLLRGTASIDLDGTLAKSHERVLDLVASRHPDSANEIRMFTHAWSQPKEIMPLSKNIAHSLDMMAESWRLVLLTGTSGQREYVCEFLETHGLRFDALIFSPLHGKFERIVGDPQIKVHFDDDPYLACGLVKKDKQVVLVDREYNRQLRCSGNLHRMTDWSQAAELLRNI